MAIFESDTVRHMWKMCVIAAMLASGPALDQKDVEYGQPGGHAVLLDLHVPEGPGPFPAAILVHGGGFDQGSKSTNVKPLFDVLSSAGIAYFSIDYRMAPEFHFTEANEDVDSAILWVKANAKKYRINPKKIALIGESAGGLLVNYAGTHETKKTRVAGVMDFYGPVDYGLLLEQRRDHPERFNMDSINKHAANGRGRSIFSAWRRWTKRGWRNCIRWRRFSRCVKE